MFVATADPFCGTQEMCETVANSVGASTTILEGRGHWWMFGDLAPVVDALLVHWRSA